MTIFDMESHWALIEALEDAEIALYNAASQSEMIAAKRAIRIARKALNAYEAPFREEDSHK